MGLRRDADDQVLHAAHFRDEGSEEVLPKVRDGGDQGARVIEVEGLDDVPDAVRGFALLTLTGAESVQEPVPVATRRQSLTFLVVGRQAGAAPELFDGLLLGFEKTDADRMSGGGHLVIDRARHLGGHSRVPGHRGDWDLHVLELPIEEDGGVLVEGVVLRREIRQNASFFVEHRLTVFDLDTTHDDHAADRLGEEVVVFTQDGGTVGEAGDEEQDDGLRPCFLEGVVDQLFAVRELVVLGQVADGELVVETIVVFLVATRADADRNRPLTEDVQGAFGKTSTLFARGEVGDHAEHVENLQPDEAIQPDQHVLVILIATGVHDDEQVAEKRDDDR